MRTLSRFFWKNTIGFKDTFIYDLGSESNAIEMARSLQGASSADLYMIDFSTSGVCLPSSTGRRFEFEIKPKTIKLDLSAYKRPGDGAGLGVFFVVYINGAEKQITLTAPSPRAALIDNAQASMSIAQEICRTYSNAAKKSHLSVSCVRIKTPKIYQKSFDGVVWYPKK